MRVIEPTGVFFNPQKSKALKQDENGHTWIVVTTYTLSRKEAEAAENNEHVNLDMESFADVSPIVCFRCELTFSFAKDHRCPGEPKGYESRTGRPIHHERWVRDGFKEMDKK